MRVIETVISMAFLLLIAFPLMLMFAISKPYFHVALIPIGLILLYSSARLAKIASSWKQRIIATTFWLFVYVFLGLCPFLQLSSNLFPWPGSYGDTLLVKTAFIILTGLLAFDVGHFFLRPAQGIAVPKLLQRRLSKITILLLSCVSLLSSAYFLQKLGGLDVIFLTRFQLNQELSSEFELHEILILSQLFRTPVYVLLIAMLYIWITGRSTGQKIGTGWKVMSIFLFVATMVLNNPINTARLKVGTILLSLFFVLPWRRWSNAITVAGLIVGLIIVFPFADLFRLNLDSNLAERVSNTSVINELTDNGDYDAFQMVVNTVAVVEKTGFQFGRQIGGALLFWMPRFIWTDKPMATGQWIAEHMGYGFVNLSAPLWAEFYLDGGWFLIILAFFGYGYLVCTLDRWYAISIHIGETQVISVLVPIYAGYQFFLLRGSLMPAVAYFAPMLLFVVVLSIPIKIRKERFRSDTAA